MKAVKVSKSLVLIVAWEQMVRIEMKKARVGTIGWALLFLILGCAGSFGQNPKNDSEIKAVINYSVAPWDGSAYEILIPLQAGERESNPFITINIWGNPEFEKSETFQLQGAGDSREKGSASFQPVLNGSRSEILVGTVTFKSLQKDHPVSATFDLLSSSGRVFKGQFQATWGNKPIPYIR
jgi:hypothetical protein